MARGEFFLIHSGSAAPDDSHQRGQEALDHCGSAGASGPGDTRGVGSVPPGPPFAAKTGERSD